MESPKAEGRTKTEKRSPKKPSSRTRLPPRLRPLIRKKAVQPQNRLRQANLAQPAQGAACSDGLGNFLPFQPEAKERPEQQVNRDARIGLLHLRHARLAGPEPGSHLDLGKAQPFPHLLWRRMSRPYARSQTPRKWPKLAAPRSGNPRVAKATRSICSGSP